jgi:hypothetical protein
MTDPHQVNSIISSAIMSCKIESSDAKLDVEEAKHMAKCIVTALTESGFDIVLKKITLQPAD